MTSRLSTWLALVPLYVAMATAIGFTDYHVRLYPDLAFTDRIPEVLAGTAAPPGRYRVLAPYLADALERISPFAAETDWLLFRWLCLFASLLAGHVYFRTWFTDGQAVLGNALIMALLPLTFTNSWAIPDQFTELALFTFGCACIARGWWTWFLAALVANALNRETSAFLVLLFLLSAPPARAHLARVATAGAVWLAITLGLRWQLGYASYDPWQFWQNVAWLIPLPAGFPGYKRIFGWFFVVLLVPCFLLATIARRRRESRFVWMATTVVSPLYVVTGFLFSSTIETRIFTPILPLLAPGMMAALLGSRAASDEHGRSTAV